MVIAFEVADCGNTQAPDVLVIQVTISTLRHNKIAVQFSMQLLYICNPISRRDV